MKHGNVLTAIALFAVLSAGLIGVFASAEDADAGSTDIKLPLELGTVQYENENDDRNQPGYSKVKSNSPALEQTLGVFNLNFGNTAPNVTEHEGYDAYGIRGDRFSIEFNMRTYNGNVGKLENVDPDG